MVGPKTTIARKRWVRWPPARTAPKGPAPPHRAPLVARAAVFGNVVGPAQLSGLTGGVQIDLWVEATTDYVPAGDDKNYLRESNDVPTFGEINLRGPGSQDGLNSVGLTFTFKRRDNRAEVTIPWMQLTFFDFDQDIWQGGNAGREVPPPRPALPPSPRRPCPTAHRPPLMGVPGPNRSAWRPRGSWITRCPAAAATWQQAMHQPRWRRSRSATASKAAATATMASPAAPPPTTTTATPSMSTPSPVP